MEELRQFPIQQGRGTFRVFFEAANHAGADVGGGHDLQRAIGDGFFPWRYALAEAEIQPPTSDTVATPFTKAARQRMKGPCASIQGLLAINLNHQPPEYQTLEITQTFPWKNFTRIQSHHICFSYPNNNLSILCKFFLRYGNPVSIRFSSAAPRGFLSN